MPVKWKKTKISDEKFESAGAADLNNDGVMDIISGAWWYEGPDFTKKHKVADVHYTGDYYDDFANIMLDINGDGLTDYVTGAFWSDGLRWHENPGDPDKEWPRHHIDECGGIERPCAFDIDGCGTLEIIPNTPGNGVQIFKLKKDKDGKGMGEFEKYTVREEAQGHGIGAGDIAGNGRGDIVLSNGWLESPENPYEEEWIWHPEFQLFWSASTPIVVADVNGTGLNDIIVGGGHEYGLEWWEQRKRPDGARRWVPHPIDPFNSQYHDLQWVDIDGDGQCELVTGKRYWAHNGNDPGANDDLGLYYFKYNGETLVKQFIDYGPPTESPGAGIHMAIADLAGNGRLDVIAPGKAGLYVFENLGNE